MAEGKCPTHGRDVVMIGVGRAGDPCNADDCEEVLWAILRKCPLCGFEFAIWDEEAQRIDDKTIKCQCGALLH